MSDHTPILSTHHSWVSKKRISRSHELFINHFKTFLLVPTYCFTANQIAVHSWQIKIITGEERVSNTPRLSTMNAILTSHVVSYIICSILLNRKMLCCHRTRK